MKKNKNQKSMNKKDLYGKANYSEEIKTVAKIAVGVIIVLALIYLGTALLTGEIKFGSKEKEITESKIQYEEIIAGQILNRIDEEYYVLLFSFTSSDASRYVSLKDSYLQNTDALPFYIVDLDKKFNESIIASENEEYVDKPSNVTDLKVNGTTILKVKDKKVTERIETDEKVKEYFEKID